MTRRDFLAAAGAAAVPSSSKFVKGFCAALFPLEMPYADCMRQTKNAGFDAIELRLGRAELSLDCSIDAARRLAEQADALRIRVASLWALTPSSPSLANPDAAIRQQAHGYVLKAMELAPALQSEALLVTPAVVGLGARMQTTSDKAWDLGTQAYREFLPIAAQKHILLTPENVWNHFLVSPREMRAFIDQFPGQPIGAHFDVGNCMAYGYPQDWIVTLGSRIRRVHFKDYRLALGGKQSGFVPLLEGDVPWASVMSALGQAGYQGFISAETALDNADANALLKVSRAMDRILAMG
jgi:hexulose-6-phosphate isomerase